MSGTYVPMPAIPGAPLAANDADVWTGSKSIWENHEAIYVQHAPRVQACARSISDTNVSRSWLRWRLRGNLDLHPLRWRAYLTPSGGTPTVTLSVGTATTTGNVSGTGWLNVDVTPVAGDVQDCLLSVSAGVGVSLTHDSSIAHLVPSARISRQASGYIGDDEDPDDTNVAINVEHIDRLERGPILIAKDRPHCVLGVSPKLAAVWGGKGITEWLGGNTTSSDVIGHAMMPRVDTRARRYIVDAFVATDTGAQVPCEVRVGAWRWQIPACGSWQSTTVILPPGPLPVSATVTTGAGIWAQLQGLQIWRL